MRLPKGPRDLMKKVERVYDIFFKLWNVTMVPRLMKLNKWYETKSQLQVGDIVYFRNEENELSSDWTVGKVISVEMGKDGMVRRANIQYQNFSENFSRETDRAARSLIKLFNIDDENWQQDMDEVEKLLIDLKDESMDVVNNTEKAYSMTPVGAGLRFRLKATGGQDVDSRQVGVQYRSEALCARESVAKKCKNCCCLANCTMTGHARVDVCLYRVQMEPKMHEFAGMLDRSWDMMADTVAVV